MRIEEISTKIIRKLEEIKNALGDTSHTPTPETTYTIDDIYGSLSTIQDTLESSGGVSLNSDYKSPGDFTVVRKTDNVLTLSSLPSAITNSAQIAYIKVIRASTANIYVNGAGGVVFNYSAGDVTIIGAGTSPFGASDVYEVGINQRSLVKAVDATTTAVGLVETAVALARTTLSTAPISMQAEYVSPIDFIATYTSNVTITCTGAPFTIDDVNCTVISIMYKPTAGSWTKLTNTANGVSITASANVITVAGAGTPFASGDSYRITISGQRKGYDPTTNSTMSSNLNPDSERYVQDSLIDGTGTAAATSYWPSSDGLSMDGYKSVSFTGYLEDADSTITLTIEATNDEDTAAGDWIDVTKCFNDDNAGIATSIGASIAVSSSTKYFAASRTNFNFSSVRVKYVTGDSTNTIHIKARRVF